MKTVYVTEVSYAAYQFQSKVLVVESNGMSFTVLFVIRSNQTSRYIIINQIGNPYLRVNVLIRYQEFYARLSENPWVFHNTRTNHNMMMHITV